MVWLTLCALPLCGCYMLLLSYQLKVILVPNYWPVYYNAYRTSSWCSYIFSKYNCSVLGDGYYRILEALVLRILPSFMESEHSLVSHGCFRCFTKSLYSPYYESLVLTLLLRVPSTHIPINESLVLTFL